VPVPIYADSVRDEMAYVLEHAGHGRGGGNQEQVDKVLVDRRARPTWPHGYDERRGLRDYDRAQLAWIDDTQKVGRENLPIRRGARVEIIHSRRARVRSGGDPLYLGTTGRPKGVMLSFDNNVISARNGNLFDNLDEKDEVIAYLRSPGR